MFLENTSITVVDGLSQSQLVARVKKDFSSETVLTVFACKYGLKILTFDGVGVWSYELTDFEMLDYIAGFDVAFRVKWV